MVVIPIFYCVTEMGKGLQPNYFKVLPLLLACLSSIIFSVHSYAENKKLEMSPSLSSVIEKGDLKMLETLLKQGADPNLATASQNPALYFAIHRQNITAVQILLKYNANPNAQYANEHYDTPLSYARDYETGYRQEFRNYGAQLRELLLYYGANDFFSSISLPIDITNYLWPHVRAFEQLVDLSLFIMISYVFAVVFLAIGLALFPFSGINLLTKLALVLLSFIVLLQTLVFTTQFLSNSVSYGGILYPLIFIPSISVLAVFLIPLLIWAWVKESTLTKLLESGWYAILLIITFLELWIVTVLPHGSTC